MKKRHTGARIQKPECFYSVLSGLAPLREIPGHPRFPIRVMWLLSCGLRPAMAFQKLNFAKQTPTISDFRHTIYEPVAASHRHPRSGFPRQKEGTIKHAILRNEAKLREGLFFIQVAVRQAIVRDFWPYFRGAILKNEANLSIYDCRLPICDCGEQPLAIFFAPGPRRIRSKNLKQKSD
jgi:hypothetical protein